MPPPDPPHTTPLAARSSPHPIASFAVPSSLLHEIPEEWSPVKTQSLDDVWDPMDFDNALGIPLPHKELLQNDKRAEILLAGGDHNYYITNEISDDTWVIEEPKELSSIVKTLHGGPDVAKLRKRMLEAPVNMAQKEATERSLAEWKHRR